MYLSKYCLKLCYVVSVNIESKICPNYLYIWQDFKTWNSIESRFVLGKNELDIYFDDELLELNEEHSEDFDVLLYWKFNEKKFLILSIMARDVLSIPITIVASESSFSIGGRVLTKYRSSTLPEHIQMLICTRSWLHGFSENMNGNTTLYFIYFYLFMFMIYSCHCFVASAPKYDLLCF